MTEGGKMSDPLFWLLIGSLLIGAVVFAIAVGNTRARR
jgi:hypothetical protein